MTDPGLPLTTGEGNTARPWQCEGCDWLNTGSARECDGCGEPKSTALLSRSGALADLSEARAEVARLREQLDAARQALEEIANTVDPCSGNDRAKDLMDALLTVGSLARAALGVEGPAG